MKESAATSGLVLGAIGVIVVLGTIGALKYVLSAINKKVNTTSGSWTPEGRFQGNIWDEQ